MRYAKSLSAAGEDPAQVGVRGRDLALLREQRFAVPETAVILAPAYDDFLEEHKLKYKIDYILSHVQKSVPQSLANAYNSVRRALTQAQLQEAMEQEMRELFESLASEGIGIGKGGEIPLRLVLSPDYVTDPESNDTVIQNVRGADEFLIALREAWALAYLPTQVQDRMQRGIDRFRLAIIVQAMAEPATCCHGYSSMPQDRKKIYLQTYYGHLDLREKVRKDYYAIGKETLDILLSEIREQPQILETDEKGEISLSPLASKGKHDKLNRRDVEELARLTKKAERTLQAPIKAFFCSKDERHSLLWVNRLGFEVIGKGALEVVEIDEPSGEERLSAELKMVRQFVERKFREHFPARPQGSLAGMLSQLNHKGAFARPIDSRLLGHVERKLENEEDIPASEREQALSEITYVMTHA